MSRDESSAGTDRQELVEAIALLDAFERRLHRLGGRQSMSVGPPLADVGSLRETVVERGNNYGVLDGDVPTAKLRYEATELDVSINGGDDGD